VRASISLEKHEAELFVRILDMYQTITERQLFPEEFEIKRIQRLQTLRTLTEKKEIPEVDSNTEHYHPQNPPISMETE
jgi:hypothetical protein